MQVFPDKFGVVRNVELKVAQKFDGKAKYKFKEPSLMKRHVGRLIVLCAADEVKAKMRLQSLKVKAKMEGNFSMWKYQPRR